MEAPRNVKELKLEQEVVVGDKIEPNNLIELGDIVNVQGTTKGKGFAGVMKRWGFAGGKRTHGQSDRSRAPGSIGQGTDPGRVHKGKKMPGRDGSLTQTVKNLSVLHFDQENSEILVSGHVPGNIGGILKITVTGHKEPAKLTGLHAPVSKSNDKESDSQPEEALTTAEEPEKSTNIEENTNQKESQE